MDTSPVQLETILPFCAIFTNRENVSSSPLTMFLLARPADSILLLLLFLLLPLGLFGEIRRRSLGGNRLTAMRRTHLANDKSQDMVAAVMKAPP